MPITHARSLKIAVGIALIAAISTGCPTGVGVVVINDPALDAIIRAELSEQLGFLTAGKLLRLRSLDASGLGITDLSGLEFCVNLTFLDLSGNPVSDITPLASLDNLLILNLDETNVFECTSLAGLLNLDSLSLCGTLVTDIQPLVTNSINGGLGPGDFVNVSCGTLGDQANDFDIPFLQGQGVNVVCCDE